jgi:hypothetical protein
VGKGCCDFVRDGVCAACIVGDMPEYILDGGTGGQIDASIPD